MYAWLRLLGGWSQAVDTNGACALTPLKLGTRGALPSFSCHRQHWSSSQDNAASAEVWMRLEPDPSAGGKRDHGSASIPWHSTPPVLLSSVQPSPQWRGSPSPGTLLSPVSHSVCANSLESRGAGRTWGPAAVGLQGGPCQGRSELSLPKPGLPEGSEPSRARLDHCGTLNPQPARAAAGRGETESQGGEEVTRAVPQKHPWPLCHLLSRSCL